ncbi:hypothetical protein ACP4OV_003029 [Aristida adscensionis]
MDSSANRQWLAKLEDEELGELEFMDPLSMQQLAESLADELWSAPPPQGHQGQPLPPCARRAASPTGFAFAAGAMDSATSSSLTDASDGGMFSLTDGGMSAPLSFSGRHQQRRPESGGGGGGIVLSGSEKWCPAPPSTERRGGGRRRASAIADEHVVAERRRREKMHQQFATLASIVPDITKTDKVSVLGSTIEYVHQLRDRLRALQEGHHSHHQSTADSPPPLDARCCVGSGADDDGDGGGEAAAASAKVEADVRGATALLRVVCREKKGVLITVLTELEKLGLAVVNTSVVPFAGTSLNITITAQIEDGCSTAVVEVVKTLNSALRNF